MNENHGTPNYNFWNELPAQFFALAPMADVTDTAFRRMISKYSTDGEGGHKHLVIWNEFVAADGMVHPIGRTKLELDLAYDEIERPLIAQIFSGNPEHMKKTAEIIKTMGYDGIDINMGCPDRGIEKQLSGAALIKDKNLAGEIIKAVKEGAGDMPVSVKTRVGYHVSEIDTWIPFILHHDISALTLHARTKKDMSKVPANWDYVKSAVSYRNHINPHIKIIGNGDVNTMEEGRRKINETGCDGVMVGRGFFGRPWLCNIATDGVDPDLKTRLHIAVEHARMFEEFVSHKNFAIMKKHFRIYANGFPGAHELRNEIMESCNNAGDIERVIGKYLKESNM